MAKSQEVVRKLFTLPEQEDVLDDFSCSLKKKVTVHGRLFCTDNFLWFYSNVLGFKTKLVIPFTDIINIEKHKTSRFNKNAIQVQCADRRYLLSNLLRGNEAYHFMRSLWRATGMGSELNEDQDPWSDNEDAPEIQEEEIDIQSYKEEDVSEEIEIMKVILPLKVEKFFDLFIHQDSVFSFQNYATFRGDQDVEFEPWVENEEIGGFTRDAKFRFRASTSQGPSGQYSRCHQAQKYTFLDNKLQFSRSTNNPDVPYGAYYNIEDSWYVTQLGEKKCQLRISANVVFQKATNVKSKIIQKCVQDVEENCQDWLQEAKNQIQQINDQEKRISQRVTPQMLTKAAPDLDLKERARRNSEPPREGKAKPYKLYIMLIVVLIVGIYIQYLKRDNEWLRENCTCPAT